MVQTGWPIGALLAAAFVAVVTAIFGADSWRLAFLLATIPAVLVALLCRTLRRARNSSCSTGSGSCARSGDAAGAASLAAAHDVDNHSAAPFKRIFHGVHLRNTIVLSVAWLFNWFAIQTFSVLGTTVLETGKGIDASNTLMMVVVSNLVGVDRISRPRLGR